MWFQAPSSLLWTASLSSSEESRNSKLWSSDCSSGLLTPVTSNIRETLTSIFSLGSIQTALSLHVHACTFHPNGSSVDLMARVNSSEFQDRHFRSRAINAPMTSSSTSTSLLVVMDTRKSGHFPRRHTSPLKSRSLEVLAVKDCPPARSWGCSEPEIKNMLWRDNDSDWMWLTHTDTLLFNRLMPLSANLVHWVWDCQAPALHIWHISLVPSYQGTSRGRIISWNTKWIHWIHEHKGATGASSKRGVALEKPPPTTSPKVPKANCSNHCPGGFCGQIGKPW